MRRPASSGFIPTRRDNLLEINSTQPDDMLRGSFVFCWMLVFLVVCPSPVWRPVLAFHSNADIVVQTDSDHSDDPNHDILINSILSEMGGTMTRGQNPSSCHQFPSIYLSSSFCGLSTDYSPPIVRLKGPDESVIDIGMGHSSEGQVEVLIALMKKKEWTSIMYFTDKSHNHKIMKKLENETGFHVTSDLSDTSLEVVFELCSSSSCYERFVEFFLGWVKKFDHKQLCWILSEEAAQKVFQDLRLRKHLRGIEMLGIKRSVSEEQSVQKIMKFYQTEDDLNLNEETTFDALYLYEAMLVIQQFLNCSCSFSEAIELLKSDGGHQIKLDSAGRGRIHMAYEVYQLDRSSTEMIWLYKEGVLQAVQELKSPKSHRRKRAAPVCSPAKKRADGRYHFIVSTVEEAPFAIFHSNGTVEGAMIDILDYLADSLNFTYEVKPSPDGQYGTANDGNLTGIIKEVYECRADLGAGALTITAERGQFIDFTMPWFDFGLLLLTRKPEKDESDLGSFAEPFKYGSWLVILITFVVTSLTIPFIIFLTDHERKYPKKEEEDETKISFWKQLYASFWYFFTTGVGAGPDGIRRLPTKFLVGGWYFFVLILVSSYTANLAAFLTYVSVKENIANIDELSDQTTVPFGTLKDTSVEQFFVDSGVETYQKVGSFMRANPSYMVTTAQEGVARVKNGTEPYIFILDSPILYYHVNREPCNSRLAGRKINMQGYGIAMPQGMPYRGIFSLEIVKFRDTFYPVQLKKHWFDGLCGIRSMSEQIDSGSDGADSIEVTHILGPFIFLLIIPLTIALCVAFLQRIVIDKGYYKPAEDEPEEKDSTELKDKNPVERDELDDPFSIGTAV
eukprot:m.158531 g.158531  ORF g.158531 m.158531 type:complete len:847 (+) comp38745_c0_seq2:129-2669(+)